MRRGPSKRSGDLELVDVGVAVARDGEGARAVSG